jgi:hypothetical protein
VYALFSNMTGLGNNAVGNRALVNNTGSDNTAIGNLAGSTLTTGDHNLYLGSLVGGGAAESNTTRIKNISSTPISSNYLTVVVDNGGTRLGYASSSRRYKENIETMASSSEALYDLKPVTFYGKADTDPVHAKCYGLIAEDVAAVARDLVAWNGEGEPETVRYDAVNAMLLNEFLKEHKRVQELRSSDAEQKKEIAELRSTISRQQADMEALVASQSEQAAQIAEVKTQLNLFRAKPQIATNSR